MSCPLAKLVHFSELLRTASEVGACIIEAVHHRTRETIAVDHWIIRIGPAIDDNLDDFDVLEFERLAEK